MALFTFTVESDAIQGDDWRPETAELIELSRSNPDVVHVARTTGARREASAGKDPAAATRLALMNSLPEITETAVYGVSRYGEAVYAGPGEQEDLDNIRAALWPHKRANPDLSDANDALHLATHLKYRRDYFVTTDGAIHGASTKLAQLGIRVVTPSEAVALALAACNLPPG